MKAWLHKIEVFVDKIIPFLLLILLVLIIGEIGYRSFMEEHRIIIDIIDGFIVFVFVLDLIFKYLRIRNLPKFLRASWIDIIAIFPFFLLFRLFGGLFGLFEAGETVGKTQKIVHVGFGIEKEIGSALKEGGALVKEASRAEKFEKFLRPISKTIRISKIENPDVKRETKRDVKVVGKTTEVVINQTKKGAETLAKEGEKVILKDSRKRIKELEEEVRDVPRNLKAALFYEKPKIMRHVTEKINKEKNKEKRR